MLIQVFKLRTNNAALSHFDAYLSFFISSRHLGTIGEKAPQLLKAVILVLGLRLGTKIFGLGLESQVFGLASSGLGLDVTGLVNT
jgi:hypothetical protein